ASPTWDSRRFPARPRSWAISSRSSSASGARWSRTRTFSRSDLETQRAFGPAQHRVAAEKVERRLLHRARLAAVDDDAGDDRVAWLLAPPPQRGPRRGEGFGAGVGPAAPLHPRPRHGTPGRGGRDVPADNCNIADARKLVVVGDAGGAIAEADLGP